MYYSKSCPFWIDCSTRGHKDGGQRNPAPDSYISVMFQGTEMQLSMEGIARAE
jgi:hypothetical protein